MLDCRKQMYPFLGRKEAFCLGFPGHTKRIVCDWMQIVVAVVFTICVLTQNHSPLLLCPEAGSKGPLLLSRCAHKCLLRTWQVVSDTEMFLLCLEEQSLCFIVMGL